MTSSAGRIIGIRHRVKFTTEGEQRPTQVVVLNGPVYELESDDEELDFVLGRYPVNWRKVDSKDDLTKLPAHHIKWRKIPDGKTAADFSEQHVRFEEGVHEFAYQIPASHDGLKSGDKFALILGGTNDRLAFALANRGNKVGANVYRLPPFILARKRGNAQNNDDAKLLVQLFVNEPNLFYEMRSRDQKLIRVIETLRVRNDAMAARIACEQRLCSRYIGNVFLNEDGQYPEGSISAAFADLKANDQILGNLVKEESAAGRLLERACEDLDVFRELFDQIEGVGPAIGARIIAAIVDIRRFENARKLKAYMGAHVLKDGRFPRRRNNELANWNPDARQALFLAADQFNRRPASKWGRMLTHYKQEFLRLHPEPVLNENGKKRYTKGHIHKMAQWRTTTKFVEWLWGAWWQLEGRKKVSPSPTPSPMPVAA